jgi:hypothetical protein
MPPFDAGLFLLMTGVAFVLFFMALKYHEAWIGAFFLLMACVLFFGCSLVLVSGIPVVFETTTTNGVDTWTETNPMIKNHGDWFGWALFGFGMFSAMLLIYQTFPRKARFD